MRTEERIAVVFLALVFLDFGAKISTGSEDFQSRPWRRPENGGINVLYCYLRANEVTCEYSDLVIKQSSEIGAGAASAATLAHLSAKNGLPLQVVSLTMDELRSCSRPVIVHIDGETPDAGAFLLLLSITDKEIFFVSGPSASMKSIFVQDFRRIWSGYALLPVTNRKRGAVFGAIGFSIGLSILPLVNLFARCKRVP